MDISTEKQEAALLTFGSLSTLLPLLYLSSNRKAKAHKQATAIIPNKSNCSYVYPYSSFPGLA